MSALAVTGWLAVVLLAALHLRHRELVARARHELAGPLQAAGLALHAARRERPSPRLAAIDLELRRATLALDDLDAARAGRAVADTVQTVDVGCLLAEQALAWQPVVRERGRSLRVAAASGLLVHADPVRLAQAVGNLLANALEHGEGRIELRAGAEGSAVRIEVRDEGPGVARVLRRPRAGRGERGRGLAIAADIARRHGGRMTPSDAGVSIVLPAQRRAAA
jgi:signal transduction histidine kinase